MAHDKTALTGVTFADPYSHSDNKTQETALGSSAYNLSVEASTSNYLATDNNKLSLSHKLGPLAGNRLGLSNRKSLRDRRPKLSLELVSKGPSMVNTCEEKNLLNTSLTNHIY